MGTLARTRTSVGDIAIREESGGVITVLRTRDATREEKIRRPGIYEVVDVVTITYSDDAEPSVSVRRREDSL